MNKPKNIIVHHSITPRDYNKDLTEQSFNNTHKAKDFPASYFDGKAWYIGYHYVIFGDGEVRQYRTETTVGAHCKEESMNYLSIGICLVGNFDKETPSEAQKAAAAKLIEDIQKRYDIADSKVVGHRRYATYKSCPGKNIPDDILSYLKSDQGHWSDEARDWHLEHELCEPHDVTAPMTWGEYYVMNLRTAEKLMQWVDDKIKKAIK
jgi:N-acetyl-anhydromuramyl-L-alanine amidase AmpD